MARCALFMLCISISFFANDVQAQNRHGHNQPLGKPISANPYVIFPLYGFHDATGHHMGQHPSYRTGGRLPSLAYLPQPIQVVSYPPPMPTFPTFVPYPLDLPKTTVVSSTPAARLKSLDLQARGDQRMREQKWSEARAAYSSSVTAAPDRATAHLRLGLCFAVIQRYESAIREIKRAVTLDRQILRTSEKLETIFGPDSKAIRASFIGKLGDWVRDDGNNPDRLFLYGVVLRLNGDPRWRETLESAMRKTENGDVKHIAFLLKDGNDELFLGEIPKPNDRPVPGQFARPNFDLRFPASPNPLVNGPVPMP